MTNLQPVRDALKKAVREQIEATQGAASSNYQTGTVVSLNDDGTAQVSVQGVLYTCGQQYPLTQGQQCIVAFAGGVASAIPLAPATPQPDVIHPPFLSGGVALRFLTLESGDFGTASTAWRFQDSGSKNMYRWSTTTANAAPGDQPALARFSPDGLSLAYLPEIEPSVPGNVVVFVVQIGATLKGKTPISGTPNLFQLDEPELITRFEIPGLSSPEGGSGVTALLPVNGGKSCVCVANYNILTDPVNGDVDFHVFWGVGIAGAFSVMGDIVDSQLLNAFDVFPPESVEGPCRYGIGADSGGEPVEIFDGTPADIRFLTPATAPDAAGGVFDGGNLPAANLLSETVLYEGLTSGLLANTTSVPTNPAASAPIAPIAIASHSGKYNVGMFTFIETPGGVRTVTAVSSYLQQNTDPFPASQYAVLGATSDMLGNTNAPLYLSRGPISVAVSGQNAPGGLASVFVRSVTYDDDAKTVTIGAGFPVSPDQSGNAKFNREVLTGPDYAEEADLITVVGSGGTR